MEKITHMGVINCLELIGTDRIASGGAEGAVKIWDRKVNSLVDTLEAHTKGVTSMRYNISNKTLVTGSEDGVVIVWRQSSQKDGMNKVHVMRGQKGAVNSLAF